MADFRVAVMVKSDHIHVVNEDGSSFANLVIEFERVHVVVTLTNEISMVNNAHFRECPIING